MERNGAMQKSLEKLIPGTYVSQAQASVQNFKSTVNHLLEQRKIPDTGWSDAQIELFLLEVSLMDSNNFPGNAGVGEREARFASALVRRRHFGMGHGIGRSGDLEEVQPKAAGSSVLAKLASAFLKDALRIAGVTRVTGCFLVPMATGMTLTLCLLSLRKQRPQARYVLFPRVDQKSCFKSISTAGYEAVVVENYRSGDELSTDLDALEKEVERLGASSIVCVLSITSCFAPRSPDDIVRIATLCRNKDIPHIINNAYGVQSSKCMHLINEAARLGRVDAFVQSTDKNFLVPVGGAIVAGFDKDLLHKISTAYPGRASATVGVDVLITLLSLGVKGWKKLLEQRKEHFSTLRAQLEEVAAKHGERVLHTPKNNISIGMTLSGVKEEDLTRLGSMLFLRNVSGTRVITTRDLKTIANTTFIGWGAHSQDYPVPYLTAAAALGIEAKDIETFVSRLDKVLTKVKSQSLSCPPKLCNGPVLTTDDDQEDGL